MSSETKIQQPLLQKFKTWWDKQNIKTVAFDALKPFELDGFKIVLDSQGARTQMVAMDNNCSRIVLFDFGQPDNDDECIQIINKTLADLDQVQIGGRRRKCSRRIGFKVKSNRTRKSYKSIKSKCRR